MRMPTLLITLLGLAATLASAQETNVTLSAAGTPALRLRVPQAAVISGDVIHTLIKTTNMSLHIWFVPNVAAASDAVSQAPELIKSEFVKFKPATTKNLTIAGAPAIHILGPGNEADDGDPGNAEVVLFAVNHRVFAACVHGEYDDAARQRSSMLAVLQSAAPASP